MAERSKQPARSKVARGYQLAARREPQAKKASAKGFIRGVSREMSTACALRAIVAHGLSVLTANAERLMRYESAEYIPEYIHQARVSLRRVRSAIRLLDSDWRDVPEAWGDELRWLTRALGAARDADVMIDETLARWSRGSGDIDVSGVVIKANQRRTQEHDKIRSALQSTRYAALVRDGKRWCTTRAPTEAERLCDIAAPQLQSAADKLFRTSRSFAELTPENRHQVRILAKRLRYALDVFSATLPKHATKRYVDALSDLQDVLGELNDDAVALSALPKLSKSARLKKAARDRLALIEGDRVRDVERRLLALSKLPAPWR